jgi:uncharacterized iron-regulated protein
MLQIMLYPTRFFRRCRARFATWTSIALGLSLASGVACAAPVFLIFGEQHDQPDHQRQVAEAVRAAASEGRLAAVVLEMADQGHDTAALPRHADEAAARRALAWAGWPWNTYSAVVMAAVRAGVPVVGGNLPRPAMRAAMADATLDPLLAAPERDKLLQAVRDGHCGLLPPSQEPGMLRIQIARDRAMAQTLEARLALAAPGSQVLLLAGAMHASRDRGVPLHLMQAGRHTAGDMRVVLFGDLAPDLSADERRPAAFTPQPDPCIGLEAKLLKHAPTTPSPASAAQR